MKSPEEVKREFVNQWLGKADADLRASRHPLAGGEAYAAGAAFHAQQAAEKYLKSLLVWCQVEFSKTHDIGELLDLIARFDEELSKELQAATALTPYAVELRYPHEMPEPSLDQAREAVALAEEVRVGVLEALPLEFAGGL
ncbi:MAG: HEPN domain-containing protein [Acidobacteriota bacterium]